VPFLYHARPERMRGETLYPLNRLRVVDRELYDQERRKYDGREELLELRIPLLEVLWNDALHLSPIDPRRLAAAWSAAGLSSPAWEREFFAIPIERIDAGRAVWFESGALPLDHVVPFDPAAYRELREPPAAYLEYLRNSEKRGRPPRPFGYLPHVLVAAPIAVAGVRVVTSSRV
jgi:hypothetical protein